MGLKEEAVLEQGNRKLLERVVSCTIADTVEEEEEEEGMTKIPVAAVTEVEVDSEVISLRFPGPSSPSFYPNLDQPD